jgi:leader peptidase (prepilin peptidase)/N-methyltransferase
MHVGHPHAVAAVVSGLVGLAAGSFAGVIADRVPRGESIVKPASHCTGCGSPLRPRDNIPVVSYIWLRGRCHSCGQKIPPRDLWIELATVALFVLVAWRLQYLWALPAYLVAMTGLVALSAIDLEHHRLPTPVILGTAVVATPLLVLASGMTGRWDYLLVAAAAAAACFAAFFLLFFAVPKGMGFGDVRLSALCGGLLGWLGVGVVPVGILAGFVLAGVPAIVLLLAGKVGRRTRVAFGPFLAAGAVVGICFGPTIVHAWPHG